MQCKRPIQPPAYVHCCLPRVCKAMPSCRFHGQPLGQAGFPIRVGGFFRYCSVNLQVFVTIYSLVIFVISLHRHAFSNLSLFLSAMRTLALNASPPPPTSYSLFLGPHKSKDTEFTKAACAFLFCLYGVFTI